LPFRSYCATGRQIPFLNFSSLFSSIGCIFILAFPLPNWPDPNALYSLEEINVYPGTSSSIDAEKKYSGEFLMTVGFNPVVNSGRSSVVFEADTKKLIHYDKFYL
jgi:hypothetical protein